jgi:hypothetical protein
VAADVRPPGADVRSGTGQLRVRDTSRNPAATRPVAATWHVGGLVYRAPSVCDHFQLAFEKDGVGSE